MFWPGTTMSSCPLWMGMAKNVKRPMSPPSGPPISSWTISSSIAADVSLLCAGYPWAAAFYPGSSRTDRPEGHRLAWVARGQEGTVSVPQPSAQLPVGTLQHFLDEYLLSHPGARVDYIHGEDVVRSLAAQPDTVGFLLPAMGKEELFPTVIHDGVLPRKTFSMGEAHDKRFYLEARRIRV